MDSNKLKSPPYLSAAGNGNGWSPGAVQSRILSPVDSLSDGLAVDNLTGETWSWDRPRQGNHTWPEGLVKSISCFLFKPYSHIRSPPPLWDVYKNVLLLIPIPILLLLLFHFFPFIKMRDLDTNNLRKKKKKNLLILNVPSGRLMVNVNSKLFFLSFLFF